MVGNLVRCFWDGVCNRILLDTDKGVQMKYQKGYLQIQREKEVKKIKFYLLLLKAHFLFLAGIVLFLIVLGIVGAVAR
jgi:hypothetical protein